METTKTQNKVPEKVIYTAKTKAIGGREGSARSSDGRLEIQLSAPGSTGSGTNPEQLFAAGWSACFIGAIGGVARKMQIELPNTPSIDAEVDLGSNSDGYLLQARLKVTIPGIEREQAQKIVDLAHETCPYSKATRGNINVEISLA